MEERGDGELKLASVRAGGGGVLEVWGGELVRERGDWDAGVPLVLKRTRGREPRLFPELATAAAMWQWSSRRWPPGLPERQRRRSAPAAEETEREIERERGGRRQAGPVCKFRKV